MPTRRRADIDLHFGSELDETDVESQTSRGARMSIYRRRRSKASKRDVGKMSKEDAKDG